MIDHNDVFWFDDCMRQDNRTSHANDFESFIQNDDVFAKLLSMFRLFVRFSMNFLVLFRRREYLLVSNKSFDFSSSIQELLFVFFIIYVAFDKLIHNLEKRNRQWRLKLRQAFFAAFIHLQIKRFRQVNLKYVRKQTKKWTSLFDSRRFVYVTLLNKSHAFLQLLFFSLQIYLLSRWLVFIAFAYKSFFSYKFIFSFKSIRNLS